MIKNSIFGRVLDRTYLFTERIKKSKRLIFLMILYQQGTELLALTDDFFIMTFSVS